MNKLLSVLLAAVFATLSFAAIAADAPMNAPAASATPVVAAPMTAPADKPTVQKHKRHHAKKVAVHKRHHSKKHTTHKARHAKKSGKRAKAAQ